tara:strand:- start:669 stop:1835 length:1167 start_codon:yes stop_codon:yes gene_type:complete
MIKFYSIARRSLAVLLSTLVATGLSHAVFAANNPDPYIEQIDNQCDFKQSGDLAVLVPNALKKATESMTWSCKNRISEDNYQNVDRADAVARLDTSVDYFSALLDAGQKDLENQMGNFFFESGNSDKTSLEMAYSQFKDRTLSDDSLTFLSSLSTRRLSGEISVLYGSHSFTINDEDECNEAIGNNNGVNKTSPKYLSLCYDLITAIVAVYQQAQQRIVEEDLKSTSKYLDRVTKEWEAFRTKTKPQMPWELGMNGASFSKSYTSGFLPPPSFQWIALHPGIAVDNLSTAADGNQMTEAFMLEIIGLDFWKQDRWYLPTGSSVTVLYADRADTSDFRWGLSFVFNNSMIIGPSVHGKDYGVFLTLDLMELFNNRSEIFEEFNFTSLSP